MLEGIKNTWTAFKQKYPSWVLPTKIGIGLGALGIVLGLISLGYSIYSSIQSSAKLDQIAELCGKSSFDLHSCNTIQNYSKEEVLSLIDKFQGDSNKFYELGKAQMVLGNYSGAKSFFLKSLDENINNPEIYYDIAWVSYQIGEYNDTVIYCTKYMNFNPGDLYCPVGAALSDMSLGNYQNAENIYTQLIPVFQMELVQALDNRAFAYGKLGQYSNAINDSIMAAELSPWVCRYTKIAGYYGIIGNYSEAQLYLLMAQELDENYTTVCTTTLPSNISRK